ncbi:hypothetical protein B9Z55_013454 [Caenorhabditis nigoni]|uniref:One cut domain family member n=1 Tax=Caenorhabditis nigoni TaxID=1611254 RepID=A0A2G5U1V0_9PELO|nr:hypothetical protein B9Z55_013454 [Caenorhabditis nigoni]
MSVYNNDFTHFPGWGCAPNDFMPTYPNAHQLGGFENFHVPYQMPPAVTESSYSSVKYGSSLQTPTFFHGGYWNAPSQQDFRSHVGPIHRGYERQHTTGMPYQVKTRAPLQTMNNANQYEHNNYPYNLENFQFPPLPEVPQSHLTNPHLSVSSTSTSSPCTLASSPSSSISSLPVSKVSKLDVSLPEGTIIDTTDILNRCEDSRTSFVYKGKFLTQKQFSEMVLGKSQGYYSSLFKHSKPWKSLMDSGKQLYIRMFNWLNLDDNQKQEYLEIEEIKEQLFEGKDESVGPKPKKNRTKFTKFQLDRLNASFDDNCYPTAETKAQLAKEMGLADTLIIENWFLNRRRRMTKQE